MGINWEWFLYGFVFVVAWRIGSMMREHFEIARVKTPCTHHTWEYEEERHIHICKVCNRIAGEMG